MIILIRYLRLIAVICLTIVAINVQSALAVAVDDKNACGLLTASEIESLLGTEVKLKGMALMPTTHICTGQTANTEILLRLVTDLDPDRDFSGSLEKD